MSEDLTRKMPSSFEERVLAEFAAMRQEFAQLNRRMDSLEKRVASVEARLDSLDARLTSLEEKVDARLRETRPIWEAVQMRLTGVEKEMATLNRQFRTLIRDSIDVRSRVEKLEDEQAARES